MTILEWTKIASAVIGAFSIISTITPNRADNVVVDILLRLVNAFGMNFGKSTNEVD